MISKALSLFHLSSPTLTSPPPLCLIQSQPGAQRRRRPSSRWRRSWGVNLASSGPCGTPPSPEERLLSSHASSMVVTELWCTSLNNAPSLHTRGNPYDTILSESVWLLHPNMPNLQHSVIYVLSSTMAQRVASSFRFVKCFFAFFEFICIALYCPSTTLFLTSDMFLQRVCPKEKPENHSGMGGSLPGWSLVCRLCVKRSSGSEWSYCCWHSWPPFCRKYI